MFNYRLDELQASKGWKVLRVSIDLGGAAVLRHNWRHWYSVLILFRFLPDSCSISPSVCESFYHDFVPCLLALMCNVPIRIQHPYPLLVCPVLLDLPLENELKLAQMRLCPQAWCERNPRKKFCHRFMAEKLRKWELAGSSWHAPSCVCLSHTNLKSLQKDAGITVI